MLYTPSIEMLDNTLISMDISIYLLIVVMFKQH